MPVNICVFPLHPITNSIIPANFLPSTIGYQNYTVPARHDLESSSSAMVHNSLGMWRNFLNYQNYNLLSPNRFLCSSVHWKVDWKIGCTLCWGSGDLYSRKFGSGNWTIEVISWMKFNIGQVSLFYSFEYF